MRFRSVHRAVAAYRRESGGAAAVEFAFWVALMIIPLLSIIDVSFFVYQRMQVENAAQVAAQRAWAYCDKLAKQPATLNCTGVNAQVVAAAQSSSLGSRISVVGGAPTEGYYCVNSAGALYLRGAINAAKPACAGGDLTPTSADYVQVQVTFTFNPVFRGVSIASALPPTITRTAWVRLA